MSRSMTALLVALAVWVASWPVAAHHSFAAQYDRDKPVTLTGAVTKIEWMNQHVYFYVDVTEPGGAVAHQTPCTGRDGGRTR